MGCGYIVKVNNTFWEIAPQDSPEAQPKCYLKSTAVERKTTADGI